MDDEQKRKNRERLERAITPKGIGYTSRRVASYPLAKQPDWSFWRNMLKVEAWQACALALNIDPDSLIRANDGMGALGSGIDTLRGFPSDEAADKFSKLLRMLEANQFEKEFFSQHFADGVRLSEFAAWCVHICHDIPQELVALAKGAPQTPPAVEQAADAEKAHAATDTSPSSADWKAQAKVIADECFDADTKQNCRDSLVRRNKNGDCIGGYSYRVMELMQERGIKGPRGIIDNGNYVSREALQGEKWWADKSK